MKNIIVAGLLSLSAQCFADAQVPNWEFDRSHSSIKFAVEHMMVSEVEGKFDDFTLDLTVGKDDFSDAVAKVTIPVKSINTDDEKRDEHLRGEDFFDSGKFSDIVIDNARLEKTKKGHKLKGKLTIKGVSKDIVWDATFKNGVKDPWGNTRAGLKIIGVINRQDFGVKYSSILDNGGLAVGNDVKITGNIELVKKAVKKE